MKSRYANTPRLSQGNKEVCEHGHVSETVSGAAPEDQVTLASEHKRIFIPVLWVGRNNIEMTSNERHYFVSGARVLDDHITTTFHKGDTLNFQRAAILFGEGGEQFQHEIRCQVLIGNQT